MSSNIQFAGPFLKGFVHQTLTTSSTANAVTSALTIADAGKRRAILIIQNQTTGNYSVGVILNDTDTTGILIPPLSSISIDNYNGPVRIYSSSTSLTVHIAYAYA